MDRKIQKLIFIFSYFLILNAVFPQNTKNKTPLKSNEYKISSADNPSSPAASAILRSNPYKEKTIFVLAEYYNVLNKLTTEEKVEKSLKDANEAETMLEVLSELSFTKDRIIKIEGNDFSPYMHSKTVNAVILAKLKGRYTNADRALTVSKMLSEKLSKEIELLKKQVEDPSIMTPKEEQSFKEETENQIDERKNESGMLEEDLTSDLDELNGFLAEKKVMLLQLRKLYSLTDDKNSLADVNHQISVNNAEPEKEDLDNAMRDVENISKEEALEEEAFILAALSDIDSKINDKQNELDLKSKTIKQIKDEIRVLQEHLKNPRKNLTNEEKEKLSAEFKARILKLESDLKKQQNLMPGLKQKLENKKSDLAQNLNKYPTEVIESVNQQAQLIDSIFQKFSEYKQTVELFEKKQYFRKAFQKDKDQ